MNKKSKEFKNFIEAIIDEHYQITKQSNKNLNYLWYLYKRTGKAIEYKPFILMAEMQLLKEMGYITSEEVDNMCNMINSEDEDNFNIAWLAIKSVRHVRIKEHGVYGTKSTFAYMSIEKDYSSKILNPELYMKTISKLNT
jgi:hypothetical protein